MIKSLLKKNKIAQRVKAVKDLFLEKLDNLILKSDQQISQSSSLSEENTKIHHNTNILLEKTREVQSISNYLMENGILLLKSSIDTVKGIQQILDAFQRWQEKTDNMLSKMRAESQHSLSEMRAESQHSFSEIRAESQQYYQYTIQKLIEIQENSRSQETFIRETLANIYSDIHNQKFKVVTDLPSFKDIEAELMSYLYSYLPHHRAVDIGANRGEVSHRLLQAGYEVYAFEPFPPVVEKLKERLGNKPNLHIFPFALGKVNEERELHIVSDEKLLSNPDGPQLYPDSDYTLLSSLSKHSLPEGLIFTETIPISVRNLESLHASSEIPSDIGLVKIDTEGSDLEVILGMGEHRYPVVVAEFWDSKFPFGQFGANNKLEDLVDEMRGRGYDWFIVIYKIFLSNDVSYYCNNKFSIENSWGNVFFFQDYQVFSQALKWCSAVMPATYFSNNI